MPFPADMCVVDLSCFLAALLTPVPAAPTPTASTVPDIRAIVPPQPYFVAASPWFLLGAVVCLLAVALIAWYLFFRPRAVGTPVPVNPRELAEQRLRELAERAGSLDARAFGNEIADVLRSYLGAQFSLRPERQTSQEFLASVAGSRAFTRSEHEMLADFLSGCDLLKFARADATLAGKQNLLDRATSFVRSSAPPPMPAEGGSPR